MSSPCLGIDLVEFVEQDGAGPFAQKVGDRRAGAESLRVRPEYKTSCNFQRCALAAIGFSR